MSGEYQKGEGDGYKFEAINVRPGVAPTTTWMAVGVEQGETRDYRLVTLVGNAHPVWEFCNRLKKHNLAGEVALLRRPPEHYDPCTYAVFLAGIWPLEAAIAVVRKLSNNGRAGPRGWARRYAEVIRDPNRREPPEPEEPLARQLLGFYLDQCHRIASS